MVFGYVETEFTIDFFLQINSALCRSEEKIIYTADCYALEHLYSDCQGGRWGTNWLEQNTDPCRNDTQWKGVVCNSTEPGARVVSLYVLQLVSLVHFAFNFRFCSILTLFM
jgi:hypothetical protein